MPKKLVLIGASTGGPGQIQKIVNSLPKLSDTTIIIAQHMLSSFLNNFASNLNKTSINNIEIAQNNQPIESGNIYIIEKKTYQKNLKFIKEEIEDDNFNPNINTLFESFVQLSSDVEILSVILTGIGDDGVEGCSKLSQNGAICMTESSESAIIDGMPSRARDRVTNIKVYDINKIVEKIKEFVTDV